MKKFLAVFVLMVLVMPMFAHAANACSAASNDPNLLPRCVNQVYVWALGLSGIFAVFMIVIGGYITLTAAGNAERASRGKSFITSSVIGLVLLFGAFLLLNTINPDLVDFSKGCVANIGDCLKGTVPDQTITPAPGK